MILKPLDVVFRDAHDAAGFLFFVHADPGQVFAGHFRIVRALIVVGVNDDANVISVLGEKRQGPRATEGVVVGMRRKQQDCFAVEIFQPRLWLSVKESRQYGCQE